MARGSVTEVNSVMTVSQVLLNSALSWLTETDIFPEIYDRLKDSPTASSESNQSGSGQQPSHAESC